MAAKRGSAVGACLTTLFTTFLAPILVNVVSGAIIPTDNNTPAAQVVAAPKNTSQKPADGRRERSTPRERLPQHDGWNHPWASAAPARSGG